MEIKRRAEARVTSYKEDVITTEQQYEEELASSTSRNGNDMHQIMHDMVNKTMAKNILIKFMNKCLNDGFSCNQLIHEFVDYQNISKLYGTEQFSEFLKVVRSNFRSDSDYHNFLQNMLTNQKWRPNQIKQIFTDDNFMTVFVAKKTVFDMMYRLLNNNNASFKDVEEIILNIETKYPEYIGFYLGNHGYGLVGRTLNNIYELSKEYVNDHPEYFTSRTINASGFNAQTFFKIGFDFEMFFRLFENSYEKIISDYFSMWLGNNTSKLEDKELRKIHLYLQVMQAKGDYTGNTSFFLENIFRPENSGITLTTKYFDTMLQRISFGDIIWNKSIRNFPTEVIETILTKANIKNTETIYIGNAPCSIERLQQFIRDRTKLTKYGRQQFTSSLKIKASYLNVKEWAKNTFFFESIRKNIVIDNYFLNSSIVDEEFINFMWEKFESNINSINFSSWRELFMNNEIKNTSLLRKLLINKDGSFKRIENGDEIETLRIMFANTFTEIDVDLVENYLPIINILTDLRVPLDVMKFN